MFEVQFVYHSFFKVSMGGRVVLIDPFFNSLPEGKKPKKRIESPLPKKSFKKVDLILVSHEHFDHFDKKAIKAITEASNCTVVAHDNLLKELAINPRLKQSIDLKKRVNVKGVEIEPLPVHHPTSFYPLGFKIEYEGNSLVHTGDTFLTSIFSKLKADVLCVPIGGTMTMDVVDAVRAVKTMEPGIAIPMHYDTFDMIKANADEFREKIDKSILKTNAAVLKPGKKIKL